MSAAEALPEEASVALSRIRACNPDVPDPVWRVMAATCRAAARQGRSSIVLTGSLARGGGDAVSDIDLTASCADPAARQSLKRTITAALRETGALLAEFPATHIALPALMVSFVDVAGTVVKVDIHYLLESEARQTMAEGVALLRKAPLYGAPSTPVPEGPVVPHPDFPGMHSRFTGWLWYTHTKIVREEYWEAEDSIAVMRSQALMPMLLFARGLPLEGFRRVEVRLGTRDLAALARTRTDRLDRTRLSGALTALCDLFEDAASAAVERHGSDFRVADLARMRARAGV